MVFKKGNFSRRCVERNDRGWLKYVRDDSSKFTSSTFEISDSYTGLHMLWIIATTPSGQYILTCWLFVHHSNFSPRFFSWSNTPRKQRAFYATVMSATSALDEREESDAALLSDPNELLSKMEAYDIDIFNSCPPVQSFDKAVLFSSDIKSFQDEDKDEEFQRQETTSGVLKIEIFFRDMILKGGCIFLVC